VSLKNKYVLILIVATLLFVTGVILSFFDSSRLLTSFRVDTYALPFFQIILIIYFAERVRWIGRSKQKSADKKQASTRKTRVTMRLLCALLSLIFLFTTVMVSRRAHFIIPLSYFLQSVTLILLPAIEIWFTFDQDYR
jgi:hypothetical protein